MIDDTIPCTTHADALAGWRCDAAGCRKQLCGKCTAKVVNQYSCAICGASATQLVVPRAERSYLTWLGKAIGYALTRGLLGAAVLAVVLAIVAFGCEKLEIGAGKADLARGLLVLVYGLAVADAAARGNVPERGALLRIGRGAVATLAVWGPAALYLWVLGVPAKGLAADKLLWLFAGLAVVYLPMAIATASTDASYADAASPFKVFELAWHLGRRYLVTFVAALLLAALAYGVGTATIAKLHRAVTAPIVTDIAAALPVLAALTAVAYVIGLLPFVHGDRFGWGDPSQYSDPLHPRLVAEAKRKASAAGQGDDHAAAAAAALAERNDLRKVHDALKEDHMLRALKLYEARTTWSPSAFDDAKLLQLGKGATRAKKHELAQRLLEEALARKGRAAGHVLIALAQLHAQLGDAAKAEALYRQVVAEHANSEAAKAAALKLKG